MSILESEDRHVIDPRSLPVLQVDLCDIAYCVTIVFGYNFAYLTLLEWVDT